MALKRTDNVGIVVDDLGETIEFFREYVAGESDASNSVGSVVRLKADGSGIDYIAKVAGYPTSIAVDASGGAFVAGSTSALAEVSRGCGRRPHRRVLSPRKPGTSR